MTKGTKIFRIIISALLALTMLIGTLFLYAFFLNYSKEAYGIYVAGVSVTRGNKDDVLGDGTVFYDDVNNILVFENATIEYEETIVYSIIDLNIELFGENKFICTAEKYGTGIYAGNYNLSRDLAIVGEGSLTIEIPNANEQAVGISASELTIMSDVTIKTSNCKDIVTGIVCASSLLIVDKATVTVNNGASEKYSVAVRARINAMLEAGTTLKISLNSGSLDICSGLEVSGDLLLGKNTTLDVSVDDGATDFGECIRVSGLMEIGSDASVTASAKNTYAIECFGTIEADKGAVVCAASEKKDCDIFCSAAVVNYGATFNGEIDAVGEIRNQ